MSQPRYNPRTQRDDWYYRIKESFRDLKGRVRSRVNVYAAAGLCLTLDDGVGNYVKALPLYHHCPVLLYLLTYDIAIDCHLIFP